jgi:hypothetical protein
LSSNREIRVRTWRIIDSGRNSSRIPTGINDSTRNAACTATGINDSGPKTSTDIAPAIIDVIATQAYTGQPVFVIPTVNLPETDRDGGEKVVSLVFTQDFTVAYRNNVNPGTATLTIHGIGKYKGEVTTTFNIERV